MNEMKRSRRHSARFWVLCILIATLAVTIITLVVAKYIKYTVEVKNTFTPAVSIIPPIKEDFDGKVKENVYFQSDDPTPEDPAADPQLTEYPVYVRATFVVTWADEDGIRYYKTPKPGEDYTISLNYDFWKQLGGDNGYYYYWDNTKDAPLAVSSKGQTEEFIFKCEPVQGANAPEGYTLSVDILVQTVQAVGTTDDDNEHPDVDAWRDAWSIFEPETTVPDTTEPSATETED